MVIIRNASFFQQFLHVLSNLSVLVGHWSQSRQEISIVKHIIIPTGRALWVFQTPLVCVCEEKRSVRVGKQIEVRKKV